MYTCAQCLSLLDRHMESQPEVKHSLSLLALLGLAAGSSWSEGQPSPTTFRQMVCYRTTGHKGTGLAYKLTAAVTASMPMPTRVTAASSRHRAARAPATAVGMLLPETCQITKVLSVNTQCTQLRYCCAASKARHCTNNTRVCVDHV